MTHNSQPVPLHATFVVRLDHFNFCSSPSKQVKERNVFICQNRSDFAEGGNTPAISFEYWTFFKQTYCDTDQTIDKRKLRVFVVRKNMRRASLWHSPYCFLHLVLFCFSVKA